MICVDDCDGDFRKDANVLYFVKSFSTVGLDTRQIEPLKVCFFFKLRDSTFDRCMQVEGDHSRRAPALWEVHAPAAFRDRPLPAVGRRARAHASPGSARHGENDHGALRYNAHGEPLCPLLRGERNDPKSKLAIPIFFYQIRQTFIHSLIFA